MEKVRPWCGQPSDRGRLKNRTELNTEGACRPRNRKYATHIATPPEQHGAVMMFCVLMRGGTLIGIGTFGGTACIVMHTRLIPAHQADKTSPR